MLHVDVPGRHEEEEESFIPEDDDEGEPWVEGREESDEECAHAPGSPTGRQGTDLMAGNHQIYQIHCNPSPHAVSL